ncbi:MAG: MBL fold metallo-hydrolase [Acidobacteria bacterium]|nr:MBL fold metallo-hydrolase [Acidobacteriota bacterium]
MSSDLVTTVTASTVVELLDADPEVFVLDVREPDEVEDWSIPGARNIPLGQLGDRFNEIPESSRVVVVCARGSRAENAARLLAERGRASAVLDGGMAAWADAYDTVDSVVAGATVVQVRRRGKGCLSYVIGAGDRAVVIDPSLEVEIYRSLAAEHGWSVAYVVDTHLHADHLSGSRRLVELTGAELWLSPHDPFSFGFHSLEDGLELSLTDGVSLVVSAVSVPGHTEGSTMYRLGEAAVFSGDTLFLESVGRPDLAEQAEPFARALFRSLHERILPLSDDTIVFPAHYGPVVDVHVGTPVAAPLGELRHSLAALSLEEEEFVAWALTHVKDRPPNYQRIVRVNAGLEELSADVAELELGPNRCAVSS